MGKMVVHRAESLPYGFTKVNNEILRSGLSANAFMVLTFALSVSSDWDFSVSGTAAVLPLSERTINSALKELKDNGFYKKQQLKDKTGKFESATYQFADTPIFRNSIEQKKYDKKPLQHRDAKKASRVRTGNMEQDASIKPTAKNRQSVSADNKDIYNKYLINKNIDIKEDLILNENPYSIENEISDFLSELNMTKIKNGGDYLH